MKFLDKYNFSDNDIKLICQNNSDGIIKNINMNSNNVCMVIDYLLEIGISNDTIKNLFIHQIGMFFRRLEDIKEVFEEYEIDSIIKSLNYDVNTIDLIEFI